MADFRLQTRGWVGGWGALQAALCTFSPLRVGVGGSQEAAQWGLESAGFVLCSHHGGVVLVTREAGRGYGWLLEVRPHRWTVQGHDCCM